MLVRDIEMMVRRNIQAAFAESNGQVDSDRLHEAIREITPSNQELKSKFARAIKRYLELEGTDRPAINGPHLQEAFEACLYEPPEPKDFEQLSLDEYRQLFLHESRWSFYQQVFNIGRSALDQLLKHVRDTRNDLSHLRDNITTHQQDQL